jgi:hypothetical protein
LPQQAIPRESEWTIHFNPANVVSADWDAKSLRETPNLLPCGVNERTKIDPQFWYLHTARAQADCSARAEGSEIVFGTDGKAIWCKPARIAE